MVTLDEHIAALAALRSLPPIDRAARATELIDDAKAVLSVERALAIAEARNGLTAADVGRQLGISRQAAGKADRTLLRAALEILLREGVASVRVEQLVQGLQNDAPISAIAFRVAFGAKYVNPGSLGAADTAVVRQAQARANALRRRDASVAGAEEEAAD